MKAFVVHGINDFRVEEVPSPQPEPGDIVVRVKASGICATDVKTLLGQGVPQHLPAILGHEVAGEVYDVGEEVSGIAPGEPVTVYPIAVCGQCDFCRANRHSLCRHEFGLAHGIDGGFAELVRIPHQIVHIGGVVKIPSTLDYELAAMAEPLSCGLASFRASRIKPEDTVVICGAGPMGLIHLLLAKRTGVNAIVIEPLPHRRKLALQLGANYVLDPVTENAVQAVKDLTDGDGAEAVITSLGDPKAIQSALPMVKKGGVINIFGGPPAGHTIQLDPRWIHYQEITITGSFASTPEDFRQAARLIIEREIDVAPLITHRFTLDSMVEAIEKAKRLEMVKGVLLA